MMDLSGTGVALITPFDDELRVDYEKLAEIVTKITASGINFIVVLGTTGEVSTLTKEERVAVFNTVCDAIKGKIPLVLGVGGNDTHALLDEVKRYDPNKFEAILSVTPYYNKPTQSGLIKHYALLADHFPKPIILYNVPFRTSVNLQAETTITLATHDNIIGIKEASGDIMQVSKILARKPTDFAIFSGDDALTFPMMAMGANGVISVAANVIPQKFSSFVQNIINKHWDKAQQENKNLQALYELLIKEGNPTGVKTVAQIVYGCKRNVRLPLIQGSEELLNNCINYFTSELYEHESHKNS